MTDLKKPLKFEDQLKTLIKHGMIIEDEAEALSDLQSKNYYRFTGYALQQRINKNKSDYVSGTSFHNIHRIYMFDESLRDIFRKYIEILEVHYRTQISYYFSLSKCTAPPYDQHYDRNNYYNKTGFDSVMASFGHDKKYYIDSLIMKHHQAHYGGKLPLWAMVEMLSFSNLSKLYSSMYTSEQDLISSANHTGSSTLKNHLHCLAVLRNKCAHAAMLYNTQMNPPAMFPRRYLRKHSEVINDTVFAYALVILKRLPDKQTKTHFITSLCAVIEEYSDDIDLSLIGFPENYLELLNNA